MKAVLVLFLSASAWAGPIFSSKIIGGYTAPNHKYPYQASLRKNGVHRCGGAIYNETVVLTAAHCVYLDTSVKTVVVGTNRLNESGVEYSVVNSIISSDYISYLDDNDIALLILDTAIVFNNNIQPIPLETTTIGAGVVCTLTGWGFTSNPGTISNDLKELNTTTITNSNCAIAHSTTIYDSNVCAFTAYGQGACYGDSGSPLACNGKLVGLVSWGEPCAVGYPDVYTRVSSFVSWIGTGRRNLDRRIVGGSDAPEGAYPYQASLKLEGAHLCGASIINADTILTAAHCVYLQFDHKTVMVGSVNLYEGGVTHEVRSVIIHDGYISILSKHDIALLKLETNIVFNDVVQPIALETEHVPGDVGCVLSGWGFTQYPGSGSRVLQYIHTKTISNEKCDSETTGTLYDSNVCTLTKAGEGACRGDSGGPLVCNNKQVGVVSWGKYCAVGHPDVFTRVSSYIDWINNPLKLV